MKSLTPSMDGKCIYWIQTARFSIPVGQQPKGKQNEGEFITVSYIGIFIIG